MHRIPEERRLTQRFAINCTTEEYRQIVDEAEHRELPPTTFARECFLEGLAVLRRKGIRAARCSAPGKGGRGKASQLPIRAVMLPFRFQNDVI